MLRTIIFPLLRAARTPNFIWAATAMIALAAMATNEARAAVLDFDSTPANTDVYDLYPGVVFPGTPWVVQPSVAPASGNQALSNFNPGEEFNNQPFVAEFTAPQRVVSLRAGMEHVSSVALMATLRAYDAGNNLVAQDGPTAIGPGPVDINTLMTVETQTPSIVRIELEYPNAYTEIIDDLTFDVDGPDADPDTQAPTVTFLQPLDAATLTGEMFLINLDIQEDRKLRTVSLTIDNDSGSNTFNMSFSQNESGHYVGPVWTGPLSDGNNILTASAEDYAGNVGTVSITVNRVDIAGRLTFPDLPADDEPVIVPRMPGLAIIPVELVETFAGSLTGRGEIEIKVVSPEGVRGSGLIRNHLNQPEPTLDLAVFSFTYLGDATVKVQATEKETGRLLSEASFRASFTPRNPVDCGGFVPLYQKVDRVELAAEMNEGIKRKLGRGSKVIIDTQVDDSGREIQVPDPDIGLPLMPMPFNLKYVDCNGNGFFDDLCDSVYRDDDGDNEVSVGDERLANSNNLRDGTTVGESNSQFTIPDLGLQLLAFGSDVQYTDLNNDGDFDLAEGIYRDVDNSNDVSVGDPDTNSDNDVRLANSPIGMNWVRRLNDMTVEYKNDPFGRGEIHVTQKFKATKNALAGLIEVDAEITLTADLRVSLDTSSPTDRIRFNYTFYHVRATTDLINDIGAGTAENLFSEAFKEDFRAGLADGLRNRIGDLNMLFLQDVYIISSEFGLGFCVPASSFPQDSAASVPSSFEGLMDMTPMSVAFANAFNPPFIRFPRPTADPAAPTVDEPSTQPTSDSGSNPATGDNQSTTGQPAAAAGMCGSGVGLSLSFGLLGLSCMTGSTTGLRRRRFQKTDM